MATTPLLRLKRHLRQYALPLLFLSLGLFFQLFVLPSSFPPSHYDVLGVRRFASIEEVSEAYEKLSSQWGSGVEVPTTTDFIKIRYAFELLTNPLLKRDYDFFGVDEHLNVIERVTKQYDMKSFSNIDLPMLEAFSFDSIGNAFSVLTLEDFVSNVGKTTAWLIQVYSSGSSRCAQFSNSWRRIASLLNGVASTGMVELSEFQLASILAERKSTGQLYFQTGLPALIAFSPDCSSPRCYVRYKGDLSVDAVVDWMATTVLGLPRILYYSKESLGQNFIAKNGRHKVSVICFSKTGERAPPFLRKAAKDNWAYTSFAFVLWREEESSVWWNMFQVESAPAIVFLKDPGVKPVVYHGIYNNSWFMDILERNKHQELPQLRSATSMELGCDARGYSRAGNGTVTWYCVILAGRPSIELIKMRETLRSVQNLLVNDEDIQTVGIDSFPVPRSAADAAKQNRLSFAWLDGEAQMKYCFFYLFSESIYDTCGPRRYGDPTDVPKFFIIRYRRNSTEIKLNDSGKTKNIWDALQEEDANLASQLVAKYNGSMDITEIIQWISQIIEDGDTNNLPYFTAKTPELIPEDKDPIWLKGARGIFDTRNRMKEMVQGVTGNLYEHMRDPRVGPVFLLAACISLGIIWLQSSQTTQRSNMVQGNMRERNPMTAISDHDQSSITDLEPKDAYQMLPDDSDSE